MAEKDFRVRKGLIVDGTGTSSIAGSLGIGTASPSTKLHVESADEVLGLFKSTDAGAGIKIDTPDDGYAVVFFSEAGTNKWSLGKLASNSDKFSIYDEVNTTPRLVIDTSGNVGIGTTSPDALLHVDTGSNSGTAIIADGDIVVRRQSDNAEAIRLNAENDVSSHADILFHESAVIAAGNDMYFAIDSDGTTSDAFFQWRINGDQSDTGSAIMTLTEAGNLGIGTTIPSTKLDVDGTVTATGFSGTVQPKSTVASAGNSTANYYAKLMTFDPDGNNHRDANAILAITTKDNGANASAIIHVKFRSNGASDAYTTDVSFISKSGNAIFNNNAFQIWSTGNGGGGNTEVMELWVQKNTSYTGLDVHELSLDKSGSCTVTYNTSTSWQSAAPTTTQQTTTQGIEMGLDVTVDGSLSATTKSFDIEHPTKEGMRLHHGSLEGPEHGVYHRGAGASSVVELPDYWTGLVDEDSITVQLTPKGSFQQLFVRKVEGNKVYVDAVDGGELSFYYNIYGTRKDVDKMEVEY